MQLKTFKVGDTIVQKNDNSIRWIIQEINEAQNIVILCRKGGYFNDMQSQFNGDNTNFEPAGRTEQRLKREEKITERQKKGEAFIQNKRLALRPALENQSEDEVEMKPLKNVNKKVRPSEIATMAGCPKDRVLEAIREKKLMAEVSSSKDFGRGVRYLVEYQDALNWAEEDKATRRIFKSHKMTNQIYLTVKEIAIKASLSENTIRKEIKAGLLIAEDVNELGKVPRYLCMVEDVEEWLKNRKPRKSRK